MNKTEANTEKTTGITKTLEMEIEELEAKIAPVGRFPNHNETLVRDAEADEIVVDIEELGAKVAPVVAGVWRNHNETMPLSLILFLVKMARNATRINCAKSAVR